MKIKKLCFVLATVSVVLIGCSTNEKNNHIPTNIVSEVNEQEEIECFWEKNMPKDSIAVIINRFSDEEYKLFEDVEKIVLDDSEEHMLIVPAKEDIDIEVWTVEFQGEEIVDKELKFEKKSAGKNFVLDIQGYRSEGSPNYKIKVSDNLGAVEYYLTYDGKNGTPDIEYLRHEISKAKSRNAKNIQQENTYFYIGKSDSWIATYSLIEAKSLIHDSLYIQYSFDESELLDLEDGELGPIEYILVGNSMEARSSYPLKLKDCGNYHVGNITNPEAIKVTFDEEMELTIKWQDKSETIKLKRQN